ncbi:hypothetical protein S83_035981 [Arachis hypogaea]
MDDHAKLTRQRRKASLSKQRGQLQPYLRSDYRENKNPNIQTHVLPRTTLPPPVVLTAPADTLAGSSSCNISHTRGNPKHAKRHQMSAMFCSFTLFDVLGGITWFNFLKTPPLIRGFGVSVDVHRNNLFVCIHMHVWLPLIFISAESCSFAPRHRFGSACICCVHY